MSMRLPASRCRLPAAGSPLPAPRCRLPAAGFPLPADMGTDQSRAVVLLQLSKMDVLRGFLWKTS